ncbi:uncharacterized protein [Amphiura filiformis]|uniref:uncharacterized protein isoform X2 n=1 Tax=Amphiura filiformis TaxID=82378 RepID=UPI003B21DA83
MDEDTMHILDDSSSDRTSDSANGSFMRLWDLHNGVTCSSLATLESGTDLEGLVDDKDIAAKAVAFVVNSSRKGVVPLCAQIAKILRAKRRLEKTVELQQQELVTLRGPGEPLSGCRYSGRTSRSTSPTPPSLASYDDSPLNRRCSKIVDHKPSRCSQYSSLSSSPRDSQSLDDQPESLYTITSSHVPTSIADDLSQDHAHQRRNDRVPSHQHVIQAEIHSVPEDSTRVRNPTDPVESSNRLQQPDVVKLSKEVQCSTLMEQSEELQRKYQQAAQAQSQLELDLLKAKAEIERLKLQLKAVDELKDERQRVCEMRIVNELPSRTTILDETIYPKTKKSPSTSPTTLPQLNSGATSPRNRSNSSSSNKPESPRPALVILPGCKCTRCTDHHQHPKSAHGRGNFKVPSPPAGTGYTTSNTQNRLTIHLDDHVSVKGDRTGYVRYIGHIDHSTNPQAIYVGVQLDLPVGRNDGLIHGKRYFWCHRNHGVFLPIQDVTAIISRKPSSKRPKIGGEKIRKHSLDSDSSSNSTKPKPNGYPMKRNKAGKPKRLLSADSCNLIQNSEIQPQPPVST